MRTGRLLLYEGWDLPNSTAWDPTRWTTVNTGTTTNVQSGGGRIALAGVTGAYGEFGAGNADRVITGNGDFEMRFDITMSSVTNEVYPSVGWGDAANLGTGTPVNGFDVTLEPASALFVLQRRDNTVQFDYTGASVTFVAATTYRVKVRQENSQISAKVWVATAAEPDWMLQATDYAYRGPGYGSIQVGNTGGNVAAASNVTYDNLYVYELVSGRRRRKFSTSTASTANLGTATVSVTANNLGVALTPAAATVTTSTGQSSDADTLFGATATLVANLAGTAYTPLVALATLTANVLGATDAATITAAAVAIAANNLADADTTTAATGTLTASGLTSIVRAALAATATVNTSNLADALTPVAATATLTANDLAASTPTFIALGAAAVTTTANSPSGTRTPAAATTTTTAGNTADALTTVAATVNATANNSPASSAAGAANVTVTASNLVSGRPVTSASVATTANPLGQTSGPVLAAATVAVTGLTFDAIILGGELLGSSRTPAAAASTVTANPFTFTDLVALSPAAVTVAANPYARSNVTQAAALVAAAASQLGEALTAQAAAVTVAANPANANALTMFSATVTTLAVNLLPNLRTIVGALSTLAANPLSLTSQAVAAATTTLVAANNVFDGTRTFAAATAAVTANPLTVGETLAAASIAVLANNLTVTGQLNLPAAVVGVQAGDLFLNPASSVISASAQVDAYALNALSPLAAALVNLAASPLATTHQAAGAAVTVFASNFIGLQAAALGLATTITVAAFDLVTLSLGSGALGSAHPTVLTFNLRPFVLASTGLALVDLGAEPLIHHEAAEGAQAAATTTASPFTFAERTAVGPLIDITANGFGWNATPATTTSSATVTAYGMQNAAVAGASRFLGAVVASVRRNEIAASVQANDFELAVRQ